MANRNITLYHYTSLEGAKGIEKTEIIKSSLQEGGRDARFGNGVYFTDMTPEDFTRSEVANNNYQRPNAKKKLAYCVIVTMPEILVKQCVAEKRRIYLHPGDVNLKDKKYVWKIIQSKFREPQLSPDIESIYNNVVTLESFSSPPGAAATHVTRDVDAGASSYELHLWLSQF